MVEGLGEEWGGCGCLGENTSTLIVLKPIRKDSICCTVKSRVEVAASTRVRLPVRLIGSAQTRGAAFQSTVSIITKE